MTSIDFAMTLYSRCRVGASYGRDGRDLTVDRHEPIHGDHLKGLMRAEASLFCSGWHGGAPTDLTDRVFGTPAIPSPWTWMPADPAQGTIGWEFTDRHRVRVDRENLAAVKDALVRGETAWAAYAAFSVIWCGAGDPDPVEEALVSLTGASVHHIGAWRRRGLGWVSVLPSGRDLATDLRTLRQGT